MVESSKLKEMADDMCRDLLPIKEGTCIDTARSSIDPRERHIVNKLDRYQLEDKYLRLLEEVHGLKKLSNCQEDKIKRLATKLMRASNNPRRCSSPLQLSNDRDKIASLELENVKLRDRNCVLRNQLLSHKIQIRSPSRGRRVQTGSSSGATTYRSDCGRMKNVISCQCVTRNGNDDNDIQNYLVKIEELETQKKEMNSRNAELERELASHMVGNQREKVAENVEYIRMWRQLKQQNEKLLAAQNMNGTLSTKINELKKILDDTTKNNREVTSALVDEKQRLAEMEEQLVKAKNSQLSLREKDEQIRDLMNEMKILQQHNCELIELSSKYSQVETENVELKKKISDQLSDHQTLKSAFNNEQANLAALQAANTQLLEKLQELQKNMDSLTIQLVSFQAQGEKYDRAANGTQSNKQPINRHTSMTSLLEEAPKFIDNDCMDQIESCRVCCERQLQTAHAEEGVIPVQHYDSNIDQDKPDRIKAESKNMTTQTEIMENTNYRLSNTIPSPNKPLVGNPTPIELLNGRLDYDDVQSLSREKILKLLEQAQINTPLEAQNAAKMRQMDITCAGACSGISETNQINSQRSHDSLRQTNVTEETEDHPTTDRQKDISCQCTEKVELSQVLLVLYEILKDYSRNMNNQCSCGDVLDDPRLNTPFCTDAYNSRWSAVASANPGVDTGTNTGGADENNGGNIIEEEATNWSDFCNHNKACSFKAINEEENKSCAVLYEKSKDGRPKTRSPSNGSEGTRCRNLLNRFTETGECTCTPDQRCCMSTDCGYGCCTVPSAGDLVLIGKDNAELCCEMNQQPMKSAVGDIGSTIQEAFDSIYLARVMLQKGGINYAGNNECFDLWREMKAAGNTNDGPTMDKNLKTTSRELDKCRELLRVQYNLNGLYQKEARETGSWNRRARYKNYEPNFGSPGVKNAQTDCFSDQMGNTEILRMAHISDMARQLEDQKEQISKLQRTIPHCENAVESTSDCKDITSLTEVASFPMLITTGQGLVEIHILCLQLSTSAAQILFKNNVCDISVFISWDLWGQETAFTPILKYPKLSFNSSSVYRIPELHKFFDCVLREHVIFQVHLVNQEENSYTVAKAKLCVKDILDYPQNKLHYIAPVYSVMPCSPGANFGQLSLWVRLSCDVDLVESFKDRRGLSSELKKNGRMVADGTNSESHVQPIDGEKQDTLKTLSKRRNTLDTVPEDDRFTLEQSEASRSNHSVAEGTELEKNDSLGSGIETSSDNNSNAARSASSIIATMDNESDSDGPGKIEEDLSTGSEKTPFEKLRNHEDSAEQIETPSITEFNNVLENGLNLESGQKNGGPTGPGDNCVDDVSLVFAEDNWQDHKRSYECIDIHIYEERIQTPKKFFLMLTTYEIILLVRPKSLLWEATDPDTIAIEIVSMTFFQRTPFLTDPSVHFLYIEFAFLGYRGADMETPSQPKSTSKNEPIVYNVQKKFLIDEETHSVQRNMLTAMLSGDVKPNIRFTVVSEPIPEETDTKECVEVGHADFNVKNYAFGDGFRDVPLVIMNPEQTEQIGVLKISVTGIEAIRNCMMKQKQRS